MNLNTWSTMALGVMIAAIIIGAGYYWRMSGQYQKERDYARAELDSVKGALVFTDSALTVERLNNIKLKGRKPSTITVIIHDTIPAAIPDTMPTLAIDTTLEAVDSDSLKVWGIPFKANVSYSYPLDMFFYDFQLSTIREIRTIKESNVYSKPAIIIEPTFWQKSQWALIGGGTLAIILLILGATH